MLKKSLLFMTVISLNILPGFASEEQKEEKKSFFPQNFTATALEELKDKFETKEGYKVFSISQEDKEILYSYSPSKLQVISGGSFHTRVNKTTESVTEDTAIYEIKPVYYGAKGKITVTGKYDVFHSFLPDTEFSRDSLCLHRLWEVSDDFSSDTGSKFRLNSILARLFYVCKVLEKPEEQRANYHAVNKADHLKLGRVLFDDYLKSKGIPQETRIKLIDQETESLDKEFYQETADYLKSSIHAILDIDEKILKSMYQGEKFLKLMEEYMVISRVAGEKESAERESALEQ